MAAVDCEFRGRISSRKGACSRSAAGEMPVGTIGRKCYNDRGLREFEIVSILTNWSLNFEFADHPRGSYE